MLMSMPIREDFKADHPFVFLLVARNGRNGLANVLFEGRVLSPQF